MSPSCATPACTLLLISTHPPLSTTRMLVLYLQHNSFSYPGLEAFHQAFLLKNHGFTSKQHYFLGELVVPTLVSLWPTALTSALFSLVPEFKSHFQQGDTRNLRLFSNPNRHPVCPWVMQPLSASSCLQHRNT